ncbi:PREDICTED: complement C3 alpha chain-like [Nanorana parkeri]|uniref:complement C3 alpha chain-like n=1 Tax=Nanorana parkeri TaxID=125878 RepID=UPI000854499A|nr:PREDICTED: complement C3 alpha chain-like [Nanorana parkeri]
MTEASIDGAHLDSLIKEVKGNGESNMAALTAPLIAALYLDTTNHWGKLNGNRRDEAIRHIKSGIVNQLAFRKSDFSYGQWITTHSSTWLTAYVVKIFNLAGTVTKVETNAICNSVKWLMLYKQKPNGSFQESNPVSNQEMMGGNKRSSNELESTLTAFVLAAILESHSLCIAHVSK